MRTEVKVGLIIGLVAIVAGIIVVVQQTQQKSGDSDVVHVDARDHSLPAPGLSPTPPETTARPLTPTPRETPRPRNSYTPSGTRTATTPPTPAGTEPRSPAGPDDADTARTDPNAGTRLAGTPTSPRDPLDDLSARMRALAGLDARDPNTRSSVNDGPDNTAESGQPDGAAEPAERPAPTPVTSRPAVSNDPRPGPAVTPPAPPADRTSPGTTRLPGTRLAESVKRHKVVEGETLWSIAEYYLGDGKLYPRLQAANPNINPNVLKVGDEIVIPTPTDTAAGATPATPPTPAPAGARPAPTGGTATPAAKPPAARRHTYVVEEGDTLIKIATRLLKDPNKWRQIYDLNRDRLANPDRLLVGTELRIPE